MQPANKFNEMAKNCAQHLAIMVQSLIACNLLSGNAAIGEQLQIPVTSWPGYEWAYLAKQRRLDRQVGLDLKITIYDQPESITRAYAKGELQIAQLTSIDAIHICHEKPERCPVLILVLDESQGADVVLTHPSTGSIPELRGQAVAVMPGSFGPYVLSRALERHGMKLDDVQMVPMDVSAMGAALRQGRVSAATLFAPYSESLLNDGTASVAFSSADIPGEIFDVLAVDPTYFSTHGDTLAQLLQVWQRAFELARRDSRALGSMAQREGLSIRQFRQAQQGVIENDLSSQQALLAARGPLERSLFRLQRMDQALGHDAGPMPTISSIPLTRALKASPPSPSAGGLRP